MVRQKEKNINIRCKIKVSVIGILSVYLTTKCIVDEDHPEVDVGLQAADVDLQAAEEQVEDVDLRAEDVGHRAAGVEAEVEDVDQLVVADLQVADGEDRAGHAVVVLEAVDTADGATSFVTCCSTDNI